MPLIAVTYQIKREVPTWSLKAIFLEFPNYFYCLSRNCTAADLFGTVKDAKLTSWIFDGKWPKILNSSFPSFFMLLAAFINRNVVVLLRENVINVHPLVNRKRRIKESKTWWNIPFNSLTLYHWTCWTRQLNLV